MHEPPHILIVDGDSTAACMTRTLVERVDPHATFAVEPSAERGRISARNQQPDILIIDPSPYNPSDEQLIRELKADHPEVHIIVLASASTLALRRRMAQIGADLYLEKPNATPTLIDGLRAIFRAA